MTSKAADKITIVVPTYNRYPFLLRLMKYHMACESQIAVHILDSSSDMPPAPEFECLIQQPIFTHVKFEPSARPYIKLFKGIETISTSYTVLWADDDFLVPRSLEQGVRFLEANPEFSAAHGEAGLFSVLHSADGAVISQMGSYLQTSIIYRTGSARLKAWLGGGGSIFYSIQRTENLRDNLRQCHEHGFGWNWGELALGCLCVIQGKTKQLAPLYMMREIHPGRDTITDGQSADIFDWVTRIDFTEKYSRFRACLSDALRRQDSISKNEADEVVKEAFWHYVSSGLTRKWVERYVPLPAADRPGLRNYLRAIPGVRRFWSALRFLRGHRTEMSLPALLDSSSPWHDDFMPIYRAVEASTVDVGQRVSL